MRKFIKNTLENAAKLFDKSSLEIQGMKDNKANWVTVADTAIEKFIVEQIHSRYPSNFILAEESRSKLPQKIPSRMWIVDPLDGTTNATFGLPHYGISIAFMEDGVITHGGIYDIPDKQIYWAERGKGTYKDQQKLIIQNNPLKGHLACMGSPYSHEAFLHTNDYAVKIHKAGARLILVGSAVSASMYTATNVFSLYFEHGLNPWDIAAATLIIQEAGGAVSGGQEEFDILNLDLFTCGSQTAVNDFLSIINNQD